MTCLVHSNIYDTSVSDSWTQDDLTWGEYVRALGDELRRRRQAKGLSQAELAELAGLTRVHVHRIESGKVGEAPTNPTVRAVAALAAALGVTTSDLLPQDPDMP